MPSTTIHFPDPILSDIDRAATEKNISRNKFVIEACQAALARNAGAWPDLFFDLQLTEEDKRLLRDAVGEMEEVIYLHRQNRGAPLL